MALSGNWWGVLTRAARPRWAHLVVALVLLTLTVGGIVTSLLLFRASTEELTLEDVRTSSNPGGYVVFSSAEGDAIVQSFRVEYQRADGEYKTGPTDQRLSPFGDAEEFAAYFSIRFNLRSMVPVRFFILAWGDARLREADIRGESIHLMPKPQFYCGLDAVAQQDTQLIAVDFDPSTWPVPFESGAPSARVPFVSSTSFTSDVQVHSVQRGSQEGVAMPVIFRSLGDMSTSSASPFLDLQNTQCVNGVTTAQGPYVDLQSGRCEVVLDAGFLPEQLEIVRSSQTPIGGFNSLNWSTDENTEVQTDAVGPVVVIDEVDSNQVEAEMIFLLGGMLGLAFGILPESVKSIRAFLEWDAGSLASAQTVDVQALRAHVSKLADLLGRDT